MGSRKEFKSALTFYDISAILVKLAYNKDGDRHYNHANLPVCDKSKKLYYKHMV